MYITSGARRAVVLALVALVAVCGASAQSSLFVGYDFEMFDVPSGDTTARVNQNGLALEYVAHPDGNPVGLLVRANLLFPASTTTINGEGVATTTELDTSDYDYYFRLGGLLGLSYDVKLAKGLALGLGGGFALAHNATSFTTEILSTKTVLTTGSTTLGLGAEAGLSYALSRQFSLTAGVGGTYYLSEHASSTTTVTIGSNTSKTPSEDWTDSYKAYSFDLSVGVKLAL